MIFREAVQEDLDYLADNSISRGVQKHAPEQVSYIYSLEHNGKLLGAGGFQLINLHTAWCWVDMSHEARNYIVSSYKTIKEQIESFMIEHNIKRLQAYVECDFPEAIRMVSHLGFHKESIMKNFVGDNDAYMYVRVK